MPYYERQYSCRDLLEISRYFSTKPTVSTESTDWKKHRAKKEKESSAGQQRVNDREARNQLLRKIHMNFSAEKGDKFVTLTYDTAVDEETAHREGKNFIRRLQRHFKRNHLPELRYIELTEKQGQWNHHLIMSGVPYEVIDKIWGKGRVGASRLDPTNNYEDQASYLLKAEKPSKDDPGGENVKEPRKKFSRRWTFSKNLITPQPEIKSVKMSTLKEPPVAPSGFYVLPGWVLGCDSWGHLYQRYKCLKIKERPTAGSKKRRKRREK